MRILLIDDDEAYLDSLSILLESFGHNVDIAPDSFTGLYLANRIMFDLMITDFGLPRIDGLELFKKIRLIKPMIVGILVSADMTDTKKNKAIDFGMLGGFHKVHDSSDLLSVISEISSNSA